MRVALRSPGLARCHVGTRMAGPGCWITSNRNPTSEGPATNASAPACTTMEPSVPDTANAPSPTDVTANVAAPVIRAQRRQRHSPTARVPERSGGSRECQHLEAAGRAASVMALVNLRDGVPFVTLVSGRSPGLPCQGRSTTDWGSARPVSPSPDSTRDVIRPAATGHRLSERSRSGRPPPRLIGARSGCCQHPVRVSSRGRARPQLGHGPRPPSEPRSSSPEAVR